MKIENILHSLKIIISVASAYNIFMPRSLFMIYSIFSSGKKGPGMGGGGWGGGRVGGVKANFPSKGEAYIC